MKRRRLTVSAAVAAFVAATLPSAALGATVGHAPGPLVTFMASSGETNHVTVATGTLPSSGDAAIEVTDRAVVAGSPANLDPIGDCEQDETDMQVVLCPADGVTLLQVSLGSLDDWLTNGTALAVQVNGEDGSDALRGGTANEQLEGGAGRDDINGGGGNDLLYGATAQNPGAGTDPDLVAGGPGNDGLFGSSGADRLDGGPDADQLAGAGGGDILQGGDGADGLTGGDGNDTEDGGLGNDALSGGAGNDTLLPGPGLALADADTMSGGADFDTASYAARMTPVNVSNNGAADDGGVAERDNVGLDVERIDGGLASDTLRGGPGPDVLAGGAGDDTVNGGPGRDQVVGGPGRDTLAYSTEPDVLVRLDARSATTGQPGDLDQIDEVENVRGGNQGDTITGADDANILDGEVGEDYLDGWRGLDQLDGGDSADVVASRDRTNREPVSCGPGEDLAIVDRGDRVVRRGAQRCERIDNGRQTKPRPGWIYIRPRRCAASAEGVELQLPAMHRLVPLRYSILLASGYRRRRPPTLATSDCPARLTATPGRRRSASADMSGDAVRLAQSSGRRVTTTVTLKPPACRGGTRAYAAAEGAPAHASAAGERRVRLRTRRRKGRWRVKGRHSIGASEGTDWTTIERCSSTTTIVRRGRVKVTDRGKPRPVIVRAGDRYVARG